MMGGADIDNKDSRGIIPRMISFIFDKIAKAEGDIEFTIKVSMVEIYMERIQDLIDRSKTDLRIHETDLKGVYIDSMTESFVQCEQQVLDFIKIGNENRETAFTNMNANSSRSHSIFIMTVEALNTRTLGRKTGKLYLVDLAGSEKVGKTGAAG
jgi:kinesin family protein 5